MRTRVYVAGPISKGDVEANVQRGIDAGLRLLAAGYAPFIPHLSTRAYAVGDTTHLVGTGLYEQWLEHDFSFISVCHALLRLPGESAGADKETNFARSIGVPVFFSEASLMSAMAPNR